MGEKFGHRHSYVRYASTEGGLDLTVPSAVLSDGGLLFIPLYAVSAMTLGESYSVPPLRGSGESLANVSEDTVTLSALLVGAERFAWKLALEMAAESAVRGSAVASYSGGKITGLFLVTSMTIRSDMFIRSLTFSVNNQRRQAIEVSMTLVHQPRPGALAPLLDLASVALSTLASGIAYGA